MIATSAPSDDLVAIVRADDLPPLTVVVPTLRGWPAIEPCLRALVPQAEAVGASVLVVDASGRRPPPEVFGGALAWIVRAGLGIFDLRAEGLRLVQSSIVAVTEDHCVVSPAWCQGVLDAHAASPDALAVKGVVMNGSPHQTVDWAAFLLNHQPHVSPLDRGTFAEVVGHACVSYRRVTVERMCDELGQLPSVLLTPGIARTDICFDERLHVHHVQSLGRWGTMALQFHNARAACGAKRRRPAPRDLLRLAAAPVMPLARVARLMVGYRQKDVSFGLVMRCLPWIVILFYAKGAGEVWGYLTGPGDSASRIQ